MKTSKDYWIEMRERQYHSTADQPNKTVQNKLKEFNNE